MYVSYFLQFLSWYSKKEDEWTKREDREYATYLDNLANQKDECNELLVQVEKSLAILRDLSQEYQRVSHKTNSLHVVSEKLLADQSRLIKVRDEISERLNHFRSLDRITQALDTVTLSVHSPNLESALDQLNEHIRYHKAHTEFKDSWSYVARYEATLSRLLSLMVSQVSSGLTSASSQAVATSASHYPRFQSAANSIRPIVALLEARTSVSSEYEDALTECQQCYVSVRESLIGPSVRKTMSELAWKGGYDHCSHMRSACAFLIHVSQDEHRLYHQFFDRQTDVFNKYLESLCTCLYDTTRPMVIHMKYLESLAELCSILRLEMLQEHVSNNREALSAFGNIAERLLQDVQERLIFRTYMYLKTDIAEYKPSPGDLAYPEKLHMMQSLNEQERSALSESRSSLVSVGSATSQEVAKINTAPYNMSEGSPADLHGMWYPPVRRTLVCLSRMYRCVERPIFQGIAQEALTLCMENVQQAANQISANKSALDGEMFQIKHLLILREQIAPFQVDFTIKSMLLDFSKTKTAAIQLINKKSRLFSLSSNNALLEFLLEGSPEVREQWLDSRKDVDRSLKASCESFIGHATRHLMGAQFMMTVDKAENWTLKETLHEQPWVKAEILAELVQSATKSIKTNLTGLQTTMKLYLANRDTEFILYRPIKNNVIGCFTRLQHLIFSGGYTQEEQSLIGCPTPEQVSILLSSVSLVAPSP
ncbi:hypothetical protein AAG570_006144 [Ranatra chinensis]|uniref:Conserved oligomeric Golgi complex subunit 3 n=1 Tax=Ranatra chinensis TaxID=642074 RepID=A0ABD0XZS7_9HEMI